MLAQLRLALRDVLKTLREQHKQAQQLCDHLDQWLKIRRAWKLPQWWMSNRIPEEFDAPTSGRLR